MCRRPDGPAERGLRESRHRSQRHRQRRTPLNEDIQPGEEAFDDVEGTEGHGIYSNRLAADEGDDVDGHAAVKIKGMPQESTEDTEGHMPFRKATEDEGDDTAGHAARFKGALGERGH